MATHAAQTNMLSQKTASGLSGRTVLAIRWGFPTLRGMLSPLTGERVLLGRDEDCQVKLPSPRVGSYATASLACVPQKLGTKSNRPQVSSGFLG